MFFKSRVETLWFSFQLSGKLVFDDGNFDFLQIFQPKTTQPGNFVCKLYFDWLEGEQQDKISIALHRRMMVYRNA